MSSFKKSWNAYKGFTKRNVKVFFEDKWTVFFSLLAPLIVLFLYLVFLKQNYVGVIESHTEGLEQMISNKDINRFVSAWLFAGVLGTSCITVSLNSLGIMVSDKELGISCDYLASPMKPSVIVLSYFTAALINTFLIVSLILTFGLIYSFFIGNHFFTVGKVILLYITTLLGSISSVLFMMILTSFFKRSSVLGAFSGIVSAGVGFIIGAYIPVSEFSKPIQYFANIFPGSHIAAIYRNLFMEGILDHMDNKINGRDGGQFCESMRSIFTFDLDFFGKTVHMGTMFLYVIITAILFLIIECILFKKNSKRK